MEYAALANLVLIVHLAFVLFVILGGALVLWRRRIAWLHLPALAWGAWIELSHGLCPLTPLENSLRLKAGEAGYAGGFIEHHLVPLIYPPGLAPSMQIMLAGALVGGNLLLYVWAYRRERSKNSRTTRLDA